MARRKRYNHKRRRGSLSFLYKLLAFVLICTAIALALTLFFRIRTIDVSGSQRYSAQEIIDAAEVQVGDNMFLMNKYRAAERIRAALPYIETVQFRRDMPDGLRIIVTECTDPAAIVQDGKAYLLCDTGTIVDDVAASAAKKRIQVKGLTLVEPVVGQPAQAAEGQELALTQLLARHGRRRDADRHERPGAADAGLSGAVQRVFPLGRGLRLQAGLSAGGGGKAGGQRKGRHQHDAGGQGAIHPGMTESKSFFAN